MTRQQVHSRDVSFQSEPEQIYTDTKANIEALSSPVTGMTAYASDTKEPGFYNGTAWDWGAGGGGLTNPVDYIDFDITPTAVAAIGRLRWSDADGTLELGAIGGNVNIQIGQETVIKVVNKTGVQLDDGKVIYINDAQGNRPTAALAQANSESKSHTILGVTTENIADNAEGFVTVLGIVRGVNTSTFADGDELYLSATVAGELTATKPVAPYHCTLIAIALNSTVNGSILVHPQIGYELDELHDTSMIGVATGDTVIRNGNVWINSPIYADTKDPTGWVDPDAVAAATTYDSTTQKITVTGTFYYYWRGVKSSITNLVSTAHANTVGHKYYLSSTDGATWTWATDAIWTFDVIMLAAVNYQTSYKYGVAEAHGLMPWQVHEELHETIGTFKETGGTLDPATYTLLSTTVAQRRPNVVETVLQDEDLHHTLPALTSSTYNKFTLSGATASNFSGLTADIVPLLANNPYYNLFSTPNWTQVLMANNSYMCVWLVGMPVTHDANSQAYRYVWIQGQSNTISLATQQGLTPADLNLGDLQSQADELVAMVKVIIRYTGGNWDLYSITNISGSKFSQIGATAGSYLSAVSTNGSLTGDGSSANPLSASSGATTATVAGTTTLTVSSYTMQEFTGSTTQDVVLPVVTTLRLGHQFFIMNHSSGTVTIKSSGGNTVQTVLAGRTCLVRCILITGTTAASWDVDYLIQPTEYNDLTDGGITTLHSHSASIDIQSMQRSWML